MREALFQFLSGWTGLTSNQVEKIYAMPKEEVLALARELKLTVPSCGVRVDKRMTQPKLVWSIYLLRSARALKAWKEKYNGS